jgi:ankyrin repeat protein
MNTYNKLYNFIYEINASRLKKAIENNDIVKVKRIMKRTKNYVMKVNEYLLCRAIGQNSEIFKLLFEYANGKNIKLNLTDKYGYGVTLLGWAFKEKNIEIAKMIIDYANKNSIILDINNTRKPPLYFACEMKDAEGIKLLMDYANKNNIILNVNYKFWGKAYALLNATYSNNTEGVKLLIQYCNENNLFLIVNDKDSYGFYPLLWATRQNNLEIVKLLLEYAKKNNIILTLNKTKHYLRDNISYAVFYNNIEMVRVILAYANENNIIFQTNPVCRNEDYILLNAIKYNSTEVVKFLIEYTNKNNTILTINQGYFHITDHPFIRSILDNNIEMIKILVNYANEKSIMLNVNEEIEPKVYPLCIASKINIEIAKILIEYAFDHRIKLKYNLDNITPEVYNILKEKEEELEVIIKKENQERMERERKENQERMEREIIEHKEILEQGKRRREELERQPKMYQKINKKLKSQNLVIAINNFSAIEYDQMDICKNEFLIVTDWNCKEGWVYGHRKDNPEEKGLFPKIFIKICEYREETSIKFGISPAYRILLEDKINQLRLNEEMQINNGSLKLNIDRNFLLHDSFINIMNYSPKELKKDLKIKYKGEDGIDRGGLLRDFFYHISKEIGNTKYSFLRYSNDNSYELEINPKSNLYKVDYLKYFRFIGRILGLAIFHKQYLSINFTLTFYKRLLKKPLKFSDLEYEDPEIYKNIMWLKENEGIDNLYLTFELDTEDCFGNHNKIELKPNGASINVTDFNKNEYIDLVIKNKLNNKNDKNQFEALKQGFYEIIPENINSIINEYDLKFLLSGVNEIKIDDWENNTEYDGYNKEDITIINFWKCVRDFSTEKQKELLFFATGSSQVPVTGFKDLQGSGKIQHFKLKRYGTENDLPVSHTCFNCIDLPPYTSYTRLKQKLLLAISEGMDGFNIN